MEENFLSVPSLQTIFVNAPPTIKPFHTASCWMKAFDPLSPSLNILSTRVVMFNQVQTLSSNVLSSGQLFQWPLAAFREQEKETNGKQNFFFMTFAFAYYPKTKMEGIEKEAIHPSFFLSRLATQSRVW